MNCLLINGEGDDDSRLDIQIKIELDLDEEQNAAATYWNYFQHLGKKSSNEKEMCYVFK